jgi:HPt (histidine-containing phosphotransfer) domain-containing protein
MIYYSLVSDFLEELKKALNYKNIDDTIEELRKLKSTAENLKITKLAEYLVRIGKIVEKEKLQKVFAEFLSLIENLKKELQ